MKLAVNKNKFVNDLLSPASKLSENLVLEFDSEKNLCKTFVNSADNSVILIGSASCKVQDPIKCVIPDCKTFLRLFSGIDDENIALSVESNFIEYKNSQISFKYHLLDESYIVNKKTISEEKLSKIEFDTKFSITKQKLSEIIKFNSIIPDVEKIYFFTRDQKVYCKVGDEQKSNTNEITTEASSEFTGSPIAEPFPLNVHNILLFTFNTDVISVSINHQLKVFKFETPNLLYVVSGLVK